MNDLQSYPSRQDGLSAEDMTKKLEKFLNGSLLSRKIQQVLNIPPQSKLVIRRLLQRGKWKIVLKENFLLKSYCMEERPRTYEG